MKPVVPATKPGEVAGGGDVVGAEQRCEQTGPCSHLDQVVALALPSAHTLGFIQL